MQVPKQQGVDNRTWKQMKRVMLETGQFDPEVWPKLDSYQRYWINETKKSYRDLESQ